MTRNYFDNIIGLHLSGCRR